MLGLGGRGRLRSKKENSSRLHLASSAGHQQWRPAGPLNLQRSIAPKPSAYLFVTKKQQYDLPACIHPTIAVMSKQSYAARRQLTQTPMEELDLRAQLTHQGPGCNYIKEHIVNTS